MVNLINKRQKLITPEKAASFIPVFISSGISILLIIFFVIPQYFKSVNVNSEYNELIQKKNELNNLKSQYQKINTKYEKLTKEKFKIIELITGTSNLETLLAELGKIASKNNVEFLSIIPKEIVIADVNSSSESVNEQFNQTDLINDRLLVEGIKKYLVDFTFITDFVSLLSFLRDLEFQDNAILLNDINLNLNNQENDNDESDVSRKMLEVTMSIAFYGKIN